MKMVCNQCGGEHEIVIDFDSRGLPFAKCTDCGKAVKKMSTTEVITYYEDKLRAGAGALAGEPEEEARPKPLCKYCTENYFTKLGRLGTIYIPIEAKYCPMCGRKRLSTDKNY